MPRKLRAEYRGAIYHVMSRGNNRLNIVRHDRDRELFLATLGQACEKTGWHVHAWRLMRNHFHLVIETPQPNLVAGMKWLLGVYTKRFNIRHKTCGHLFAGRYKALPVGGSGNGYLQTVCDYVHLNPARAKLIPSGQPLESFRWSSYHQYLCAPAKRPSWLRVDRLIGEKGIPRDTPAGRRAFSRRMQARLLEEGDRSEDHLKRGAWFVGDDEFRKELLAQMEGRAGPSHYGREIGEMIEEKAQRLVREGLARLGRKEQDLQSLPKGDPAKVELARRLREQTTVTLQWVADRLKMGTAGYVYHLLQEPKGKRRRSGGAI